MDSTPLDRLVRECSADLPLLCRARKTTDARLARRAALVEGVPLPPRSAVVFVGSWGRREVTTGSDNDFYVLVPDEQTEISETLLGQVRLALTQEESEFREANAEFRGPGREGTFGKVVSLPHLTGRIGRNHDTNNNFTQRMLLVLESVALHNPEFHVEARNAIVDNYLEAPIKANQPPRLFLNDVVRYWRTVCVDFVGKMRERRGQGWGLRNAKLRTTRKVLFASGLLPLLRCVALSSVEITPFLQTQFKSPPTDRVADAFLELDQPKEGAAVFDAYERFLAKLDDKEIRAALDAISSRAEADGSDLFQEVAGIGDEVEQGLLDLIFASELKETAQRFGIF